MENKSEQQEKQFSREVAKSGLQFFHQKWERGKLLVVNSKSHCTIGDDGFEICLKKFTVEGRSLLLTFAFP